MTFEEPGASCGLTEIAGELWVHDLVSDGSDPLSVVRLVKRVEAEALRQGKTKIYMDSQNEALISSALKTGWQIRTILMEKTIG